MPRTPAPTASLSSTSLRARAVPGRFAGLLAAAALGLQAAPAQADSDVEPDITYNLACTFTCISGGWEIEILEAEEIQAWKIQLMPNPATFYSGGNIGGTSELITYQDTPSQGGYCDQGGYYIIGAVYLVEQQSEWNSHTTNQLNGYSPCTEAGGYTSVDDILDTLYYYTTSPQHAVPEFCTDIDCLIPDGESSGDEQNQGQDIDVFSYTDASGQKQDFDLLGETDDGGGEWGSTARPTRSTRSR